ncbi:MAG: CDP-alcohol phosphatidyltransferase family protein [Solirubrobacterales bacterium]
MLVAANILSLSRGFAAVAIFLMSLAGASAVVVLSVASAMWITDALDGWVARRGHSRGATVRTDGAALDPLMDDLAFISGFLVLLGAGAVPLWFVAGLLGSRVLFALIRITGLAHEQPFARSEPVTKLNGVVLASGQLLLLAHVGFPGSFVGSEALATALIAAMAATTAYSIFQFAFWKHGRVLIRLLTPQ